MYGQYRGIIGGYSYNFNILKRYVNPSDKTGYHVCLCTLFLYCLPLLVFSQRNAWGWGHQEAGKRRELSPYIRPQARRAILKTIRIVGYFPNRGRYKVRAFPMSPFHSSDCIYRRGKRGIQFEIISASGYPESIFKVKDIKQETDAMAGVFSLILNAFEFYFCIEWLSKST